MARPKRDRPEIFTGGEVAEATRLPKRTVQYLRDHRLGPFASRDQTGGLYGEDTLSELAMIAGCMGAGYSLTLAAALVAAFLQENTNHPPARFSGLDWWDGTISRQGTTWFHRYVILRQRTGDALTDSHDQDATLWIADRLHVLSGTRGVPRIDRLVSAGIDPKGPFALGKMAELKRGGDPTLTPWLEALGYPMPDGPEAVQEEIAYQAALRGAVGVASINLSLSIRRAFARVVELRQADGGPLWQEAAT